MRIGILTFHKVINYGAYLQAFSLSTKLKAQFPDYDVEIIDYIAPHKKVKIFKNVLRELKYRGFEAMFKEIAKILSFQKSWNKLTLSKYSTHKENLDKLYEYIDENYDLLVIGSDAVFNWKQDGFPSVFIPNYNFKKCKVTAYAASVHGMKYNEEPREYIEICRRVFSKMDFVGVRDENTAKFVNYCNDSIIPVHCCDPTLFINRDAIKENAGNYIERIKKKYKISLDEKYIVIMLQDSEMASRIAKKYEKDYKIISAFKKSKATKNFLYDLDPFEWAMLLSGAEAVITSYFHGTLLSLVASTPVLVVDYANYNTENYESKLKDLMFTRLGLSQLYYDKKDFENLDNAEEIFKVIDSILSGEYNEKIDAAISKEASAYNNFLEYVNKL